MTDLEISKKLQLKDAQNLTLADVLSTGRQHEIVETQLATQWPEAAITAFNLHPNPAPQHRSGNSRTPGTPSPVSKSNSVPSDLRPYFPFRTQQSVANDLICCGNRIFVPESCCSEVLSTLHEGHQGITKCRARARDSVWWPSVAQEIAPFITDCATCAKFRAQPAEPLKPTEFPSLPWERLACDLATHDATHYLIVVDYFSRFISATRLASTTSSAVSRVLGELLATHSIPSTLVSDNGPQFSAAECAEFTRQSGFHHRTSSPKFAQSNGEAERAVHTAKNLIQKNPHDLNAALWHTGQLHKQTGVLFGSRGS